MTVEYQSNAIYVFQKLDRTWSVWMQFMKQTIASSRNQQELCKIKWVLKLSRFPFSQFWKKYYISKPKLDYIFFIPIVSFDKAIDFLSGKNIVGLTYLDFRDYCDEMFLEVAT